MNEALKALGMTKEKAIFYLERLIGEDEDRDYFSLDEKMSMELAISALKGEWIPVSERLPKIADVYRVTRYYSKNVMNPKYIVDACFFDGSDTWYNDNRINHERDYADNVIAWQENPEPYQKGGE